MDGDDGSSLFRNANRNLLSSRAADRNLTSDDTRNAATKHDLQTVQDTGPAHALRMGSFVTQLQPAG